MQVQFPSVAWIPPSESSLPGPLRLPVLRFAPPETVASDLPVVLPALFSATGNVPWPARLVGHVIDGQMVRRRASFAHMGMQERWLSTSHGLIHAWEKPRAAGAEGPTWVFGHGLGSQSVNWDGTLQHMAAGCARVLCLDFPGHGDSPEVPVELSAIGETQAACLEAMDHLVAEDGKPVVVVGISMGGLAGTIYASERPNSTVGTVLISPAGAPMHPESLDNLVRGFSCQTYAQARWTVNQFMPNVPFKSVVALGMQHAMGNPFYRRLVEEYRGFAPFTAERLGRLPKDTLILWGAQDTVFPRECRDFFFANAPQGAQCEDVPQWNHFVNMFNNNDLGQRLVAWGRERGFI